MRIGGTLAFWVKVAIGLAALYLLWKVYQGAKSVVGGIGAAASKVGEVVEGVGKSVASGAGAAADAEAAAYPEGYPATP